MAVVRAVVVAALACAGIACTQESAVPEGPHVVLHRSGGDPLPVRVEVADTNTKRQRGLMYREEMDELAGMVFFFEEETPRAFWMKNTPLSLDILFLSKGGEIVSIAENTEPQSLRLIPSKKPAQVVLEVNAGFSKRHGIVVGDRVTYSGIDSPLLPR